MYGYVVINKPELKIREFDEYKSYYCGLCRALGQRYGVGARMSLNFDMTFLTILLNGLYEPELEYRKCRCIANPVTKHEERRSVVTDYVADMNILMTYYKCVDDWMDEKKLPRKVYGDTLKKKVSKISSMYPEKAEAIKKQMEMLSELENKGETNIDTVSKCFGNILAELMVYRQDEWKETLAELGFCLGKFVYIMDAYEDLEKDIKKNRYNVLRSHMDETDFHELIEGVLKELMAGCARYFERLPIIQDAEILRNIIYSGVWTRFDVAKNKFLVTGEKN